MRRPWARLWDAATGEELAVLRGHENTVWSIAFSPDGRRVLTASKDKTARMWVLPSAVPVEGKELPEGKEVAVLRGHEEGVTAAVFSPDGTLVATASEDKTARLWRVFPNTQDLVEHARARLPRHLTREQRRREFYLPPDADLNWAEQYTEDGEKLAREGRLAEAVAAFQQAAQRYPALGSDPRTKAETLFILGRFAEGEKLAKEGKLDAAAEAFAQVKSLSPNFDFEPKTKAQTLYNEAKKGNDP